MVEVWKPSIDSFLCYLFSFYREEQYRQLWAELDTFIEEASRTSAMHKKVFYPNAYLTYISK